MSRPRSRFPTQVTLGGGYVVKVHLVTTGAIKRMWGDVADNDDRIMEGPPAAMWDVTKLSIFVDRTMSRERCWKAYWHELLHAVHDVANLHAGGV